MFFQKFLPFIAGDELLYYNISKSKKYCPVILRGNYKKVLIIIGAILLVIVVAIVALLIWLGQRPIVPEDYTETGCDGGRH